MYGPVHSHTNVNQKHSDAVKKEDWKKKNQKHSRKEEEEENNRSQTTRNVPVKYNRGLTVRMYIIIIKKNSIKPIFNNSLKLITWTHEENTALIYTIYQMAQDGKS